MSIEYGFFTKIPENYPRITRAGTYSLALVTDGNGGHFTYLNLKEEARHEQYFGEYLHAWWRNDLQTIPGVYAIRYRDDPTCCYIGMSGNCLKRIRHHLGGDTFHDVLSYLFEAAILEVIPDAIQRRNAEKDYIRHFGSLNSQL